jgi:heptosyltransferase-2
LKKFLIIQTAFIGDVILATAVVEKLYEFYPEAKIDFLVRKGNESLLENHPKINETLIWDKTKNKFLNLLNLIKSIRQKKYSHIINLHRFASSGLITAFSKAQVKIGYDKNPLSFLFTKSFPHQIGNGKHETERNQQLIAELTDEKALKPKLYPTETDYQKVKSLTQNTSYIVIAPSSVWFTKQVPKSKIISLIQNLPNTQIYLIGAPSDQNYCQSIIDESGLKNVVNLAGQLNLLESAALIANAQMTYVNDSAPLHIASAMNAPVKAFFCSTIPEFGFGPLSDASEIIQVKENLDCRPCGLHGHKKCPKGHFKCGHDIIIK